MVVIKIKRWIGWRTIKGLSYEWVSGRTTRAGLEYQETEDGKGKIVTKVKDVDFPIQLAVTLNDGTVEYVPDILSKRIRILERP